MKYLGLMFSRGIPAYFWLGVLYGVFVAYVAVLGGDSSGAAVTPSADALAGQSCLDALKGVDPRLYCQVEQALDEEIFPLPLFSQNVFSVNGTVIFLVLGFLTSWVEVARATNIRSTARNDTWSLIVTLIAFVLFVGVSSFGTTAFLIVAVVGFGDVLLDRYVGQAVARRDFGFPGAHGGGDGGGH